MFSETRRWLGALAAGVGAVWMLQVACGPNFPNRLLLTGDMVLDRMQGRSFERAVERLKPARFGSMIEFAPADYAPVDEYEDDYSALVVAGVIGRDEIPAEDEGCCGSTAGPTLDRARLPAEFRLYLEGRDLYGKNRMEEARAKWLELLGLPESERLYRTQRACFMIGRSYQRESPERAMGWMQRVREEAARGFGDTLGLPNASIGWEARAEYDRMNMVRAIQLYLEQLAAGTPTHVSLMRCAERAELCSDAGLDDLARSPESRGLITAWMGAYERNPSAYETITPRASDAEPSFARRWAAALRRTGIEEAEGAGALAWYAYGCGDYDLARQWCDVAPRNSPEASWIRARLLARDGRLEDSAAALREMVKSLPADWEWDEPGGFSEPFESRPAAQAASGERGVLLLTARHYQDAMDAFLDGNFLQDALWVGERVMSPEEFEAYVKRLRAAPGRLDRGVVDSVSYTLARRLARLGRFEQAAQYAPEARRAQMLRLADLSSRLASSSLTGADRAAALWEMAKLLRWEGMDLVGTEFGPDCHMVEGAFPEESVEGSTPRERVGGIVKPSADELARVAASETSPDRRFHYRYRACELAWQAAALMPDEDPSTAEVLCEAGRWLAYRDPPEADRFYKALVKRCGRTELGRRAESLKWFPPKDGKPS